MNKLTNLKQYPYEFDARSHAYTLYGEKLTGVTTILGVRNHDYLMAWSVKEGVKYLGFYDKEDIKRAFPDTYVDEIAKAQKNLADRLAFIKSLDCDGYLKELIEAKKLHRKKVEKAADWGKEAHKWIEDYINGENPVMPERPEVKSCVDQFLEFEKNHKIEWLASELVVISLEHRFAGTLDIYAIVDGKRTIIDVKTSNQIDEEYYLQTAGYYIALKEMGEVAEQRIIIRLPKDGKKFEAVLVDTPLDFDSETFLHLRGAHKWNTFVENKHKELVNGSAFKTLKLNKLN